MSAFVYRFLALAMLPLLFGGCIQSAPQEAPHIPTPSPSTESLDMTKTSVEAILQKMTLRQKVGQLFMVRPDALDRSLSQDQIDDENSKGVTELGDSMQDTLTNYPVGGICQFGKNIIDPEQITAFNAELQAASALPLLIAVDEEGGNVARLANTPTFGLPKYESAAAVGALENPQYAEDMGRTIGAYLRQYGFTMDFAPVADVWTNPDNTVIGTRAFSTDAETAARMAWAMAYGLEQENILPTFKHFPGHGDTAEDSHSGLAYSYRTLAELQDCEFLPFLKRNEEKATGKSRAVMVGHIAVPALDETETPASLSHTMVTRVLREELLADEDVLVVTDSLSMGAIAEKYSPEEACIQAIQAGCDILLMPEHLPDAFEGVLSAVEAGTIPQERLEESVVRILRFKQQYAKINTTTGQ